MSQTKSLVKEELPKGPVTDVATYLAKTCGIPGCMPVFHIDDARAIVNIVIDSVKQEKNK